MQLKYGSRRMVIVTENYAFKFPKITSWKSFVFGVVENIVERYWYTADGQHYEGEWRYNELVPIVWADWLGLCVVQKRCEPLTDELAEQHKDGIIKLQEWGKGRLFCGDIDVHNVGLYNGQVRLFDYGYFGIPNVYYGEPIMTIHHEDGTETKTVYYHYWKCKQSVIRWFQKVKRP